MTLLQPVVAAAVVVLLLVVVELLHWQNSGRHRCLAVCVCKVLGM